MALSKKLIGATTDPLILAVLAHEPCHGYDIVQRVNIRSGGVFEWREGTLYPALHRLEKAGLIKGKWDKSGGRKRRVYALTPKGRRKLDADLESWRQCVSAFDKVLAHG